MRFSHVALTCADPLVIERFYTKYFGFQRSRVIPLGNTQIVFIKNGDVQMELFKAESERPFPAAEKDGFPFNGVRHIAFQVDDVDATIAAMGEDANISLGPLGFDDFIPGWRTVWLRDPEGNIIEVSQGYTDQETPPSLDA